MKEFIDKLIERLEEAKVSANRRNAFDSEISYACAIDIVNKLAEEYKGGCCEWKQEDHEDVYATECGEVHIFIDGSPIDNNHTYCPYCGKKIKVAPYTEGE